MDMQLEFLRIHTVYIEFTYICKAQSGMIGLS